MMIDRIEGKADNLTFYALLSVLQNGMMLQSDLDGFLKKYELSHGQFSILIAVSGAGNGTLTAGELAENLRRSKPTITKMVEKLTGEGYLSLGADRSDKRKKHYSLTEKAGKLLDAITPEYSRRMREFCRYLSDIDKFRLIEILNRLNVRSDRKFTVRHSTLTYAEKSSVIRSLCARGGHEDIDHALSFLDDDADLPTTKIVDFHLGTVTNPEGIRRIEHYLFHGTQIQRNYCVLFFARKNEWTTVNRAYEARLIDYRQAYSR